MITTEMKAKRGKCLALAAVLAMVLCAFAIAMPAEESNAEVPAAAINVSDITTYASEPGFSAGSVYKLTAGQTITTEIDLKGTTLYLNGNTVNVNGGTLTNGIVDLTNSTNMLWLSGGTISKITFQNYNMAICLPTNVTSEAEAIIEGCVFNPSQSPQSNAAIYIDAVGQNVTISGCTFNNLNYYNEAAIDGMVYNEKYSKVTITDSGSIGIHMFAPNEGATDYGLEFSSDDATTSTVFDIDDETEIDSIQFTNYQDMVSKVSIKEDLTVSKITGVAEIEITSNATLAITDGESSLSAGTVLSIAAGATLSVSSDASLRIKGDVENDGTIVSYGTTTLEEGSTYTASSSATAEGVDTTGATVVIEYDDGSLGLKGYIDADLTVPKVAYLAGDLVVKKGYTLTIPSTSTFYMGGHKLILEGDLAVQSNGKIVGTGSTGEMIVLTKTGSVSNLGLIGSGSAAVTIAVPADGTYDALTFDAESCSAVSMKNITGVSVGVKKYKAFVDDEAQYYATVSGSAVKNGFNDAVLGVNEALVDGDLTIGNSVEFTGICAVLKSSTLTVNGDIGAQVLIENNGALILNGTGSATIVAQTGAYIPGGSPAGAVQVDVTGVTGITFAVKSETYTKDSTLYTNQKLVLSGTAVGTLASLGYATIEVSIPNSEDYSEGAIYVEDQFYFPQTNTSTSIYKNVDFTVSEADLYVTGLISSDAEFDSDVTDAIAEGTAYAIKSDAGVTTYYIATFDVAYANMSSAVGYTISVYGDLEISGEYVVDEFQILDISAAAEVTVASAGVLTVNAQAVVLGTIDSVDGKVIVNYGGTCDEPAEYAVKSTDSENNVKYSGLSIAISEASQGDVINLVQTYTSSVSLTIPAGITLQINEEVELAVAKNLTVNGTVLNYGIVAVTGETAIAGTYTGDDGTFTAGTKVSVTGTMVLPSATNVSSGYNAAAYADADNNVVLTTLATAALAILDEDVSGVIYVYGTLTESSDVTIPAGATLTIDENATLTASSIILIGDAEDGAAVLAIDGTFTGTVSAPTGEESAIVEGAISFTKVSDMTVTSSVSPNAMAVNVSYLKIESTATGDDLSGNVTVSAGTVTQSGDLKISYDSTNKADILTVASGASYVVVSGDELTSDNVKALIIAGTLTVNGDATVKAKVSGELVAATGSDITIEEMTLTGTLTVKADSDGTYADVEIDGKIVVGSAPKTLGAAPAIVGKVVFAETDDYILAYTGADMSGLVNTDKSIVSTAYTVNGSAYMTVYASSTNAVSVQVEDRVNITGYDTVTIGGSNDAQWLNSSYTSASGYIGSIESVSYTLTVTEKTIKVSVGTGMTLYVDGLKYLDGNTLKLTVGTHTVSIAANAGYNIDDAVIMFNGQTVQNGGTITVTADMVDSQVVLSTSGATATTPVVPEQKTDDGMKITDYLLIILVVLIAIMAIMVALRMMRS